MEQDYYKLFEEELVYGGENVLKLAVLSSVQLGEERRMNTMVDMAEVKRMMAQ